MSCANMEHTLITKCLSKYCVGHNYGTHKVHTNIENGIEISKFKSKSNYAK